MHENRDRAPLVEVRGVSKRFPGVQALSGVDLHLSRGEVLAVIGENGAGKSTLMKILAGAETPDEGTILLDGKPVHIDSVRTATRCGIALIHQELNLADNLDVEANIFLGREPRRWGLVDNRQIRRRADEVLCLIGLDCPSRSIVSTLAIGQQQMVEIAKALTADARVLIMDEPTSSLSAAEAATLFRLIEDLRRRGVSIVYISHRLGEVKQVADRVVVLRDGRLAGWLPRKQIDHDRMVRLMVGRDVSQFYVRLPHEPGEVVLEVDSLRVPGHAGHPLSLNVRGGEIVSIAGLVGAGRTELLHVLFGIDRAAGGTICLAGRSVTFGSPWDAIRAGVALVPEDRKRHGLIQGMNVRDNIGLAELRRHQVLGMLNRARQRRVAKEMIRRLEIKTPGAEQIVDYLSGGNQQKVVLGKWLALRPRLLLLDEPTRGVDVGAKQEIYRMMEQLASDGVAILFASSEMEEILGMSDRALVMHQGRITGGLARDQLSEEAVMRLATGTTKAA